MESRGETQGGGHCVPCCLPWWVLSGVSQAPTPCSGSCAGCWHHVLLSPWWGECKGVLGGGGVWLGSDTRHSWDAGAGEVTGMLLSPCLSSVTNPFHPPGPAMPHPVGFLPSPAWGVGKLGTAVDGTRCSPGGFPVLSGAVGRLSQEPQGMQGLFPVGAGVALAQEGSRPGCVRAWKSPRWHELGW